MRKRKLLPIFLSLFMVGLASCNNDLISTSSSETTTTTTIKKNYYLDSDVREYLMPFLEVPALNEFKKYEYEKEETLEDSYKKTIVKCESLEPYYSRKINKTENSNHFETEEYIYRHQNNDIYNLYYANGKLSYWENYYANNYYGDGQSEYKDACNNIKYMVSLEKENDSLSIKTIDFSKKEKDSFVCNMTGSGLGYQNIPFDWSLEFSFLDGKFSYYIAKEKEDDFENVASLKFSFNTNFEKTYPDFDPSIEEIKRYEEFMEEFKDRSDISSNPLPEEDKLIDMDNNRTYYQLLVYSFADSNDDGIGDFKGIIDHLDYFVDLGIEGIWLSPILDAESYHSYDIRSYYRIRSEYEVTDNGVLYDLNYLLKECHKRNIKVLMDLVLNHTSYYNDFMDGFSSWYSEDNRFGFPEFDFDKPIVRKAVEDIGTYWLEYGLDGFRLDAAMWIYNSGNDRHEKNYEFWSSWVNKMKEVKPDCYIIGEVLDENHDLAYDYAQAGFDSTFDFNALGTVISAVKDKSYDYATNTMTNINKALAYNSNYILGRALSNHDIGRFNQSHPDSNDTAYYVETLEEIKLANALNALTPGNTFIYYGDELGLLGTCTDTRPNYYYDMNYRTPMPFTEERTNSVNYFEGFHGKGITTSKTFTNETIEDMMMDSDSIYSKLKEALKLKNNNEVFQKGTLSKVEGLAEDLSGFDVTYNGTTIRILYVSSNVSRTIAIDLDNELLYNLGASVSGNTISLNSCDLIAYQL